MEAPSGQELEEALRAIRSMLSKSEKALLKLADHPSQRTLLTDRVRALRLAETLIVRELNAK